MEKPLSRPPSHSGRLKPHRPPQPITIYDDVFGGPPRYGVPVLSPRTEDYLEIFGGFHAPSRACFRVPVLDLPLAVADEVLVDVGSGDFDYSEVFGRRDGEDVGLLDFEVVSRSDDVGASSYGDVGDDDDDAWTPEASDYLSEDSEFCGYDRTFSNGNPYMSVDGEIGYEMSFHKANHEPVPFDGVRHTPQIQPVPGFSYVVSEIPGITKPHQSKKRNSNNSTRVDRGIERVEGKEQKKFFSQSSSATSRGKSNDHDSISQKQLGRVKYFPTESFVKISEISLQTAPSNLPPPSRPPPAFDIKTSDPRGSTSCWKKNSPECDSLPDCFDVEVDGGSSAAAFAAAMIETMDQAQSQLKSVKESTERQKGCFLGPEMSGSKSGANSMVKKGSLFANSTINQMDDRVQNYSHTVNNGAKSSMRDKSRNIAGENQNEVMNEKVVEDDVRSEQIQWKKEGSTVLSVFVEDDRTDGTCEPTVGYDFFADCKNSDRGRGIRGDMLGKDVSDTKVNGLKSSEWNETRNVNDKQVENKSVMIREKEKGVKVMEVSEGRDLKKNEVLEKHSDPKHAGKAPMTEPQIMEPRVGRSDTFVVENQGGLDATEGYTGLFNRANRQSLEHITSHGDLMVSESNAQFKVHESLLSEKTTKVDIDREEYERGPWANVLHSVVQNDQNMASGNYGSAKEIIHYVANDARKEELTKLVQNKDRLPAVVEQQKVKVLLAEHYPKERSELEGTLGSAKQQNKLNIHKLEGGDTQANQQNEQTKLKEDKNGEEVPLSWATEQKENDIRRVDLNERIEMEKMLKTSPLPEDKKKIMNAGYQMEEGDKETDDATNLEEIGNSPSESCRESSTNLAAQEQGTSYGSMSEAEMYVHANESLSPRNDKGNTQEHENLGQFEAVNESDDDIEWEIIDDGLYEVVDVRELGFLNQAREKIPVDEVIVPHYGADAEFDLENLSNSKTHPDTVAPQLNKHNVQSEDAFNSGTTEMTERMDERASHLSKQDLRKPGFDIFKAAEVVHKEKYVDSRMMVKETAASADQTNYNISSEEEKIVAEAVKFKDDGVLYGVPLHRGKEIPVSSRVNGGFDGKTITDASLPDLEGGTAWQQSTSQPEEKKEKTAVSEARDAVTLSREQKAEIERLRRIEEEKEREKEREKDRMVVDKAILEARERAISESRGRFHKSTIERGTAEASRRAMMEARERLEKACAEARESLYSEKSAAEERLKLERAAVERAIAEARTRAAERAKADRSASDKFSSATYSNIRQTLSSVNKVSGEAKTSGNVEVESAQRCRARLERHRRTAERAAKALAEKNMRDLLAQREQAERSRLAETLDADVRRWSKGKEGNLRALLSTLQYILGPDSGWQPIPLTEVITSAAVKKAYRKATLCIHPDKLQQRGASIQQKYICEKVFDLLKEGWNKFNSEER
ncbi:hypothetical protein MLD38_007272 [Melastoma candidum]|uniref:Uncharacterized protein n=1 Tax=Melastoma candidum TaxID=119954 RepID=A0ACB9RUB9_9MYRT|nr:hypothetical protein MLD38_007272 [Melastoma candidum]